MRCVGRVVQTLNPVDLVVRRQVRVPECHRESLVREQLLARPQIDAAHDQAPGEVCRRQCQEKTWMPAAPSRMLPAAVLEAAAYGLPMVDPSSVWGTTRAASLSVRHFAKQCSKSSVQGEVRQ